MIDGSESIPSDNFDKLKSFLVDFVTGLNHRVAFAEFSTNFTQVSRSFRTGSAALADINMLQQSDGLTFLGSALQAGLDFVARPRVPSRQGTVVVITDGRTSPSDQSQLQRALRQRDRQGTPIFTVGLGRGVDPEELIEISGSDGTSLFGDFDNLDQLAMPLRELIDGICMQCKPCLVAFLFANLFRSCL